MERNPVQFHTNPTVPKKANKQGTLFSAQNKYSRGYTPQRMREVTQNLNSVQTPSMLVGETHPFLGRAGAAKVRETLARSNMRADKMKGANVIVRSRSEVPADQPKTVGGVYRPGAKTVSLFAHKDHSSKYGEPDAATQQSARQGAEVTLLHEMGHHRSSLDKNPESAYDTEKKRGTEEAGADAHAHSMWVPDKRDKKTNRTAILSNNSYAPTLDKKSPEFAAAYTARRNKVTQPAQFKRAGRAPVQGTLF